MYTYRILQAAIAAVLATTAGLTAAAGSTNVDVTATVPKVCTFSSGTMAAIDLGPMDPSTVGTSGVSKTGNITYNCTKGVTPVVAKSTGGTALTDTTDNTKTISYSFTLGTAEAGQGYSVLGSSKIVATAAVSQAAVQAAAAGTYKDTVTLTIDN